ncbi:MAG: hexokinase [Candidatus Omnitrophota bacterium]
MTPNALKTLERDLRLSKEELSGIVRSFHAEMDKGLSGRASSLKMIPTYVDRPTGREKGRYMALDLGGTNFRVLSLTLNGRGNPPDAQAMKFALRKRDITSTGGRLFRFLAVSIKRFIKEKKMDISGRVDLGFTFSFPVRQTGIAGGTLLSWTKAFNASGVEGRDVVALLKKALKDEGIGNISVAALTNDTVGTLVAGSYEDEECDTGVIIGTGTNACYVEDIRKIGKLDIPSRRSGAMIINIEWGNFDKLKATRYDRRLDRESSNPGAQRLEKMVSGMYLGEAFRLIAADLISRKELFGGRLRGDFGKKMAFKGEFVSQILSDRSPGLAGTISLLRRLGVKGPKVEDARMIKRICELLSARAARISSAAIFAVITRMDPGMRKRHTVAIDGSVYEKLPGFSAKIRETIGELSSGKAGRIRVTLTKDGSGRGAAIIAAVSVH